MASQTPTNRETLIAALARNRGELEPERLAALLHRLAADAAKRS